MSAVTNYSGIRLLTTAARQLLTLPHMTEPQRALPHPSDLTTIGVAAYRDMMIEYVAVPDITDGADHHARGRRRRTRSPGSMTNSRCTVRGARPNNNPQSARSHEAARIMSLSVKKASATESPRASGHAQQKCSFVSTLADRR